MDDSLNIRLESEEDVNTALSGVEIWIEGRSKPRTTKCRCVALIEELREELGIE